METTTITPQSISRILGKTSVKKSKEYKSGIKGQGYRSFEGFTVRNTFEGVVVNYICNTGSNWHGAFADRRDAAMEIITATLIAAGFTLTAQANGAGFVVTK
jgi:hypothetical protein